MILCKQKKNLAVLLLISILSMGCESTADPSSQKPIAQTKQAVKAEPNFNLPENKQLQDILLKIENLKSTTQKLDAANVFLLKNSEQYSKNIIQSELNANELINLTNKVQLLEKQLFQLKEESDGAISFLKEEQRQDVSRNLEQLAGLISEKRKVDSDNESAFVKLASQISALNKLIDKNQAASADYQNSSLFQQESNYKTLLVF
jgi:hypothetical protein